MEGKQGSFDVELSSLDGAVQLWTAIGAALSEAGYGDAGPEYLRLSQLLERSHRALRLEPPVADGETWALLQQAAASADELLAPLAEAAAILSALPTDDDATAPPAQGQTRRRTSDRARDRSAPVRTVRATRPVRARTRAANES